MAKNIEINIKGSDGSYEVLYPKVNPDILKLNSGNVNIDNSISEKLGLSDGSTINDVLGKMESGVYWEDKNTEKESFFNIKYITDLKYNGSIYVITIDVPSYGKKLYYSENFDGVMENLTECEIKYNNSTVKYSDVGDIIIKDNNFYITMELNSFSTSYYSYLLKSTDGKVFNNITGLYNNNSLLLKDNLFYYLKNRSDKNGDDNYNYYVALCSYDESTNTHTTLTNEVSLFFNKLFYLENIGFVLMKSNVQESNDTNYIAITTDEKTLKQLTYSTTSRTKMYLDYLISYQDKIYAFGRNNGNYSGKVYTITESSVTWSSFNWDVTNLQDTSLRFYPIHYKTKWIGYIENKSLLYIRDDSESAFTTINLSNNGTAIGNYLFVLNGNLIIPPYNGNLLITSIDGENFTTNWIIVEKRLVNVLSEILSISKNQIKDLSYIRVETGNYTGTGGSGKNYANSVTFNTTPDFLYIYSWYNSSEYKYDFINALFPKDKSPVGFLKGKSIYSSVVTTWYKNGVVSWYYDNSSYPDNQLNVKGDIYYYMGIYIENT